MLIDYMIHKTLGSKIRADNKYVDYLNGALDALVKTRKSRSGKFIKPPNIIEIGTVENVYIVRTLLRPANKTNDD